MPHLIDTTKHEILETQIARISRESFLLIWRLLNPVDYRMDLRIDGGPVITFGGGGPGFTRYIVPDSQISDTDLLPWRPALPLAEPCPATSYESPEMVIGEYRLWFSGYQEIRGTIDTVGICLALNERLGLRYGVACGGTDVLESGPAFVNLPASIHGYEAQPAALAVRLKNEAMDRLAKFIREKEGVPEYKQSVVE
jgi:hypothetical protein